MCDGYKTLFVSCRFSYIIDLNSKLQFLKRKRFSEKKLLITLWCVFSFSFQIIIYKHIHIHTRYINIKQTIYDDDEPTIYDLDWIWFDLFDNRDDDNNDDDEDNNNE